VAVAKAVERGLKRREAEGLDISTMGPVCTIMVGRLDDWLKILMEKQQLSVDPGYLEWAGVARLSRRPTNVPRARLSAAAAFRGIPQSHALERVHRRRCGDLSALRMQRRYNASDIEVIPRIDKPVDAKIVDTLLKKFPDFERGLHGGWLVPWGIRYLWRHAENFEGFIASCAEMNGMIRDIILPNPDTE